VLISDVREYEVQIYCINQKQNCQRLATAATKRTELPSLADGMH